MQTDTKPNSTPVAADALMKFGQQWEHIASTGHVLLKHVDAYRNKSKFALLLLSAAIIVAALSYWLPSRIGSYVAYPVGKVAGWIERKPETPATSLAPRLRPFNPQIAKSMQPDTTAPPAAAIDKALLAAAEGFKKGGVISGCITNMAIAQDWSTQDSFAPHCRYSADKTRVWVWGIADMSGSYTPYVFVLRKTAADSQEVSIYSVGGIGQPIGQHPFIDINFVARSFAADFPEQVSK